MKLYPISGTYYSPGIDLIRGDITKLAVDAIVNSANSLGVIGGGLDAQIHSAAGPELIEAYKKSGCCKDGGAIITPGFALPAKYVIHTVCPRKGGVGDIVLRRCYWNCLEVARSVEQIRTLAFPFLGSGIMGFSIEESKDIALVTMNEFIEYYGQREGVGLDKIILIKESI